MATFQIELDESLASDVKNAAKKKGLSLQDLVSETLRGQLATEQEADTYFELRRSRATGAAFRTVLDLIPDNPPDPWDRW